MQYRDGSNLAYNVHGTKHKCFVEHSSRWGTWMFVAATWTIKADGAGVVMLYIIDDEGVTRVEKSCPERSDLNYAANLGTMFTSIQDASPLGYWLDELAVWNALLPEHRIVEIYNLVTRNPSNHLAWTFELKSYPWSRKLVDRESAEHEEETGKLSSLIGKYIDHISVTKIWEEFQTDRCIYAGSVRSGVATWREDVFLPCNDTRFEFKYDNFHLKLGVKNGAVDVMLNNINLGSFSSQGYVARGGIFATSEANSDDILVRNFNLEENPTPDVFSYEDCDTTKSGPTGDDGEHLLYGTQMNTPGHNCMAIHKRPVFSSHYSIEVKLRHDKGDIDNAGFELSHMGIIFKYKSKENFFIMILRLYHSSTPCFDLYHYDDGVPRKITGGSCPVDTKKQTWYSVSAVVDFQEIKAYLDGTLLFTATLNYVPLPSKVGVAVYYQHGITVSFKDFHVEEYFVPVSSFPDTRSFQLSRIEDVVEDHSMTSIFGGPVVSPDTYTVSADFYSSTGAFGLCYNVIDDSNFDFVYYRRNRVLFAEVMQSVLNTSWEHNEILQKGIENSSFILTAKSSRRVPTHIPFNVSSFAINSTALNISWNWVPDYDVTGLFRGFRILYRNEEDPVELWEEKIVYGQEFENSSWVIINDLRKSMEYSLKVAAFSLVGDGWPSKEIFNSTMDDTPDMVDLNMTIREVNLQSAFVEWDLLPKHYWNGDEPSYIVVFQDVVRGTNITIHVPAGTSQLNYTEFRHFTNYSVSLMALNNVGSSLPSNGARLETPEYVPAVYPSNISVTTLNTSALTMSWDPIDDALWQGLPQGYVVFCNHSDDYRNFTVGLPTLEIMITNLTAFTFYDVTVAGYTGKGLGPKHPTIMARTHEEAPRYAPVNLRVLNRSEEQTNGISNNTNIAPSIHTSYSTTIEWDPVPADQVRGIIRGYTTTYEPVEVHYITRARRSLADRMHAVTLNSSTASIELDNLLFYTNYSFVVRAFTVGNGVPSSMFHFMTPEGVPGIGPGNLNANHGGSKSKLTVIWDSIPVDARNGILLGYHVSYHETSTSGHDKNLTVTTTYVKLIDLETYTSYDIRVCGFTAVGDGVCSEITAMTRSYDMAHYTPPRNATTVLTSPVSISLIWIPLPEALWFDYPRGYHITIQRVALGGVKTSGDDVITARVGYKTGSYTWTNLEFYAQYKIEISTITYRGFGPKTVLYGDTCQCPSYMTSTFQILPPYVIREKSKLVGVLPEIIRRMTSSCCVTCGGTVVDFDKDGFGEISEKGNYPELLESLDQETTFAFPIVGYEGSNTYSSRFGFVPGVESPGMVVIVKKKSAENIALTVMWSVFGVWPMLVLNVLLALIAGIVMWMLDSSSNESIFPRTCIRGCLEGFWWAFISMTTVGYGDTTAKTIPGRIFAVIWVLTGLCFYSILIGDLSSALSTSVSVSSTSLYGAKVAVLINSSEESVAIRRNAKIYGGPYYAPYEIQKSLLNGKVDAAILDIYTAALTKELWNHTDLRISQILDYSAPYGIVMAGGTNGIQRCFQSYVENNRIKTLELVLQYTSTIQGVKREETSEYVQDLIDGQSSHFRRTLLILCIILGIFFLFGVIWMFIFKTRKSMNVKKENSVHPVKMPDEEILSHLEHSYMNIYNRLKKMKKRHGDEIRRFKAKA